MYILRSRASVSLVPSPLRILAATGGMEADLLGMSLGGCSLKL